MDHHVFQEIAVTREQIVNCSFSSWYHKYKNHVPRSRVIKPLPLSFIEYLSSDGIVLPVDGHYDVDMGTGDGEYSDWSEDESNHDSESDEDLPKKDPKEVFAQFQQIHDEIKHVIKEWGAVTPKLNWSAPRDATWILPSNTMKCNNASDVYLLLNASNYTMHDISQAFDEADQGREGKSTETEYELILRKWFNVNPALEFRVFVKDNEIIGITQRELNFYDFLEPIELTIRHLIENFYDDVLRDTFPDDDYVFDVYLPRPFNRTYLIDINPFARKTDSQLFTWNELATMTPREDYELRLVTEVDKGRFAVKEHTENQVPKDVVDASLDSSAMAELAKEWQELQMKAEGK
jgi:hypothetical protein